MRNLKRYPISLREIETCLRQLSDDLSKEESVGDMRPLLLKTAAEILKRMEFVTYDIGMGL